MSLMIPMLDTVPTSQLRLRAGGTLTPGEHLYIVRPSDDELWHWLKEGEYCNVLTSRQMGKSSLMMQTAVRLRAEGVHVAMPDASELGRPPDLETWYQALLEEIVVDLGVAVQVRDWWRSCPLSTPNQRFSAFLREEVLVRLEGPVVIFLDEIDSTLRLPYRDDFFVTIRAMYNQRAKKSAHRRITFCLVGVATPNELIENERTTPYNIGRSIELRDFDEERDDLRPLYAAIASNSREGKSTLQNILYWTGGQPYLTIRLCQACSSSTEVLNLVEAAYADLDAVRSDSHFQQITRFLGERLADRLETFSLYLRILQGQNVPDESLLAHAQLKLSGIVKRGKGNQLVVRNRIYKRIFTDVWTKESLARSRRGRQSPQLDLYMERLPTPSELPLPAFKDSEIERLSIQLEDLYDQREQLTIADEDTRALDNEILDVRRLLRKGPQLQPGEFLLEGRYRLVETLGKGGFATVWKAYDRLRKELVAVKVLHGQHSEERMRLERFFRGARKMAELIHPNIVRVLEAKCEDEGWLFFVMEFVPGGDFGQAVLTGKLSDDGEKLAIVSQVGRVLEFAHQMGVIHRDVKPENVLLDSNGIAKLTDFDLVRVEDSTGFTQTRAMLGTLNYAAPEALDAPKDAGPPADIYSLASMAVFALLGGELPRGYYRDPSSAIAILDISPALARVLTQATAVDPEQRYASMGEFCTALDSAALHDLESESSRRIAV
jgi:tRNA A-37 threonylcarbamoyl transferase component Bud32